MKTKIINTPDLLKAASRKKEVTNFCVAESKHINDLRKLSNGKYYYIRTYGCQANVRDEETMRAMLEDAGYKSTEDVEKADVIIINTCAVRENAEDKVYGYPF